MARKKIFNHEKITGKIKVSDEGKKGTLRFQFLGLPKEFTTGKLELNQCKEVAAQVALDIKHLEQVMPDPQTKTTKYPFTNWQIAQIESTGHTLRDDVKRAFTQNNTFRSLYEEWSKTQKRLHVFAGNRLERLTFVDSEINEIPATEIVDNFKIIDKFKKMDGQSKETKEKIGLRSRNMHHQTIKTIFQSAEDRDMLLHNPFVKSKGLIKKVMAKEDTKGKKTYWTFEQTVLMYEAAREYESQMESGEIRMCTMLNWELYLRFGIFTGARFSDIATLRWSDFEFLDTIRCQWSFKQSKHADRDDFAGSVGEKYRVTIKDFHRDPILLEMLQTAYANKCNDEYVFHSQYSGHGIISNTTALRAFKTVFSIANRYIEERGLNSSAFVDMNIDPIKEITGSPHKMRHTMVAHIVSGSGSWDAAKNRCGHLRVETTIASYGDMMDVAMEDAMIRKQKFIDEKTELALQRVAPKLRAVK